MIKAVVLEAVFHELGCEADDWLEGAEHAVYEFSGARKALLQAAADVTGMASAVKADLDDGKLQGMEPTQVADYAILQLTRAVDSLKVATQHYQNRGLAAQGEVAAYKKMVGLLKKRRDDQRARNERLAAAIESGEVLMEEDGTPAQASGNGRLPGVRPGAGIAAQRKAEEAESDAEVEAAAKPKKEEAAPKKRRAARKKG